MKTERAFPVRRLMVALDASHHSLAALDAAARIAARFEAELAGLFVEDEDLLRWSRLPIGRAVDPVSAKARSVEPQAVEQELLAQAGRARRALEAAAERERVRWSFRVVRGRVGHALAEAAGELDLIALGRSSWARSSAGRLGSTARFVVTESSSTVLLLSEGESLADPVVVLHSGGEDGARAFAAAGELARQDGGRVVLLVPGTQADAAAVAVDCAGQDTGIDLRVRAIPAAEPEAIASAVRAEGGRLLVLAARACADCDAGLPHFLDAAPCAVLSVR